MRKVMLFAAGILIVASTAFAERVPMWRKVWEQEGSRHYINHGSLKQFNGEWSFGYLHESDTDSLTSLQLCKKSENGVWMRMKNISYCDGNGCDKLKDTDWKEVSYNSIAYHVCKVALPYCDEPSKGKKGMCQKRPEKGEEE